MPTRKLDKSLMQEEKKWKIVFLIYSDLRDFPLETEVFNLPDDVSRKGSESNALNELISLFQSLKQLPLIDNLDVYIIYNRIRIHKSSVIDDHTYLLRLIAPTNEKRYTILKEYSNGNLFQKPQSLSEVLLDLNKLCNTEHNIIITWDHGSIFGIFKELSPDALTEERKLNKVIKQESSILLERLPYNKFLDSKTLARDYFQDVPTQEASMPFKDILSVDEFSKALTLSYGKKHVDIIVMMNCLMQNVFTCDSLKDNCDYIIAPMGSFTVPGYSYKLIAETLAQNSKIPIRDLAELIPRSATTDLRVDSRISSRWAIFIVQTLHFRKYLELINDTANEILKQIKKAEEDKRKIVIFLQDLRAGELHYFDDEFYMVDFEELLCKVTEKFPEIFSLLFQRLSALKPQLILPERFIGSSFGDGFKPSGLTILFPRNLTKFINDEDAYLAFFKEYRTHYLQFKKRTKWINLLETLEQIPAYT